MKVIFDITPLTARPITGVGKVLKNLIVEFEERVDVEPIYFALTARGYLPELRRRFPGLKAPAIPARFSRKALKIAQAIGLPLDLMTGPADAALSVGWLCLPLKSGITVAIIHDMVSITNPEWDRRSNIDLFKGHLKGAEKHADLVLADSKTTKKEIAQLTSIPEERITVAYPGASRAFKSKPGQAQRERVRRKYRLPDDFLLFVGAQVPRKNLVNLIKAFARVGSRVKKQTQLILAGSRRRGRKKKWPPFVKEVGFVPDDDLPSFYWLATGLVYPSFKEGFGLPIVEAFSAETPVLTGNTSSMSEIAKGAAILVDPYSVEDIARGLTDLLTLDHQRRYQMTQAGKRRLTKFSFPKMADTIIKEIKKRKR